MNYYLFATVLAQATEPVGVPAWVPIVIAVILLLLFWWGLSRNSIPQGAVEHAPEVHHDSHEDHHDVAVEVSLPAESVPSEAAEMEAVRTTAVTLDDLKIIEGIGPKIEGILHDAAIHTFAELAAASVSELEKIVRHDAGIQVAFPDTWPTQAQLAAEGKWNELEKLQDELKGGRQA